MGKKDNRVGVRNSTSSFEAMETSVRTANSGKIQALSPPVGKILTGLCISQMVMLVVSSATLGAFVNSNVRHNFFRPLYKWIFIVIYLRCRFSIIFTNETIGTGV